MNSLTINYSTCAAREFIRNPVNLKSRGNSFFPTRTHFLDPSVVMFILIRWFYSYLQSISGYGGTRGNTIPLGCIQGWDCAYRVVCVCVCVCVPASRSCFTFKRKTYRKYACSWHNIRNKTNQGFTPFLPSFPVCNGVRCLCIYEIQRVYNQTGEHCLSRCDSYRGYVLRHCSCRIGYRIECLI